MTTERKLCWAIIGLQIIIILIKIYLSYKMNLIEERLTQDLTYSHTLKGGDSPQFL